MRTLVLAAGAAAVCVSVALTSCSSSKTSTGTTNNSSAVTTSPAGSSAPAGGSSGANGGQTATITISGYAYSGDLTVTPGAKVTVTDKDSVSHTLTGKTGNFDTGPIGGSGGTATFTAPTKPGSYALTCTFHPSMHGTLTVKG